MSKTYSTTIEITEEKEYSVTINTGLNLSAWISAGSTTGYPLNPSSYANFSALEADEKAVRQLMTVHASVDYLATARAGDSLVSSIINSNVCAKWINLSDYAYDKLSANANIKSVMNTADKYGYGEWGKINSTTWGPLGNIPIMTANNAPYGTASASSELSSSTEAYKAFDGSGEWTSSTKPAYVQYQSTSPICVKKFKLINKYNGSTSATKDFQLLASNDGSNFSVVLYSGTLNQNAGVNLEFDIDESKQGYYLYHRLYVSSNYGGSNNIRAGFQLYGRELTVKQASAPTDGREYIKIGSDYYTEDWGEKEFAHGSTRKTIYDHGVAPSGAITGGTKNPDCLTLSAVGTATVTIDKRTRKYMGGKAGLHASGTNRLKCGSGYSNFTASNMPDSNGLDISSISGSVAVGIEQTASGTFDCTEIWIE